MGWHPCWHHTCCENYHGQCYGGGCRLNPAPSEGADDCDERDEDGDEDEDGEDGGLTPAAQDRGDGKADEADGEGG